MRSLLQCACRPPRLTFMLATFAQSAIPEKRDARLQGCQADVIVAARTLRDESESIADSQIRDDRIDCELCLGATVEGADRCLSLGLIVAVVFIGMYETEKPANQCSVNA
jgi:hypothetical protein